MLFLFAFLVILGSKYEIDADIGVKIGLRSVNITLKGKEFLFHWSVVLTNVSFWSFGCLNLLWARTRSLMLNVTFLSLNICRFTCRFHHGWADEFAKATYWTMSFHSSVLDNKVYKRKIITQGKKYKTRHSPTQGVYKNGGKCFHLLVWVGGILCNPDCYTDTPWSLTPSGFPKSGSL